MSMLRTKLIARQRAAQAPSILGHDLHPPRPGHVWTMQIFPGGRRVVVQARPYRISSAEDALAKLKAGHRVYVALDDAIAVLSRAKLPSVAVADSVVANGVG